MVYCYYCNRNRKNYNSHAKTQYHYDNKLLSFRQSFTIVNGIMVTSYGWRYVNGEQICTYELSKYHQNKINKIRKYFKKNVTEELMARIWHPKNFDKFEGWGFSLDE